MYRYILQYSISETISTASVSLAARLWRGQAGVGLLVVEPVTEGRSSLSLGSVAAVPEGSADNWTSVLAEMGH